MQNLKNALVCILLASLALAAGKLVFFLDQLSIVVDDAQSVIAQAGPQMVGATIEARQAAAELAGASREQRSYYKATGKALAIATISAARLIEHTDQAVQNLDARTAPVIAATGKLISHADASQEALETATQRAIESAAAQVDANGQSLQETLTIARQNFEHADSLWPPLIQSADSLSASGKNVQEATESIRLALEPLRKPTGRLKFILHWLMGLPHISIIP
jgi:uncharacterized protein YqkB